MDPASIAAVTVLVKTVWGIAGPLLVGWHLPQPGYMKKKGKAKAHAPQ